MSYFITKSNFLNIVRGIKITDEQAKGDIYKSQIFILNRLERENILSIKQFFVNVQDGIFEFKKRGVIEDKYEYVNEVTHYAKYHTDKSCEALVSNFKDYAIPVEIRFKAGSEVVDVERVQQYRQWFKQLEIQDLLTNDPKAFLRKLAFKFHLENTHKLVEIKSKGIQSISNLSLEDLEKKIDALIIEAPIYCNSSEKNAIILNREGFNMKTYYVTSKKHRENPIDNNNTGYADEVLREVIQDYYLKIKKPIIDALCDYWIIKYNKGLDFGKNIMEQLEFKPCSRCVKNDVAKSINIDDSNI